MNLDFQHEQKRLNGVMNVIADQIVQLESETLKLRNEVVNTRKHFWDEIKVNTDSFDDFLETVISLRQEAQALSVGESTHGHAAKRLATLRRMKSVPYFGRIDFLEEGYSEPEQIYIGISSLMDSNGEDFLIYDWRAPISSVYYDYEPGPAQYMTPGGEVYGNLEKKWQYVIREEKLVSMFDTSLTIGDDVLQQVLGKGTDKYMQSIVATIQKEQNRIIRHDQGRLLIVHGAAGSGKTSAALQRIAFLLYKYRDRIKADQIILFSPNAMFNSYVSNVLPELGEENMQQVTFQEYLDHRLSKDFQLENPYDQLEYVLTAANTPSHNIRVKGIQFKASNQFFEAIKLYRETLEKSGMLFKDIKFRGKIIITAQQLSETFYGGDTSLDFHSRLEKLKDWLMSKLKEIEKIERFQPWVEEEIELLSNEAYHKIHKYLAKKNGFEREEQGIYEMDHKALVRVIVGLKLKPLRKQIQALDFIDLEGIYKQLFADPLLMGQLLKGEVPKEWAAICQATRQMLEAGKLYYEDATPFLLLQELMQGFQTNRSIKHILIDEAQDYSPFQFEFLKRLFPSAKMTVLGDFNQAIFAHASEVVDFQVLNRLYGEEETEVINMTRSYRSTKPIIEFTRSLIANGESIIPFERAGELPVLTQVKNHTELHRYILSKVSELQGEGYGSIAVICKSAEESKVAFEALNSINGMKLIKSGSAEYEQGVVVIPSYLAKGIEFEAVIIYDASQHVYGDESLRRIFYTACTRAMHELQLYSVGKPNFFIQKALQENLIHFESNS
ncbi:RNA polymerase recycling motor HelD [Lysinibacillus sp. BW-2-10]|uniref:RNA polymerase recycling motor HelD n=1 Tax=Lysinibacillus sp. BW-2-10 TaxID=2590030 RepID=UPI001181073F|nr:RNA polymerase recycling motor HelD [Lysinibacillus sp. BW-2-10]TSI02565.1 AAA family ATPase [Lysinibacillus sp. BW-2-10]